MRLVTGRPPGVLQGDPSRLTQLLTNLLSNALEFTPDGGQVELRFTGGVGSAVLEVAGTGIGIPRPAAGIARRVKPA